ncbi:MAG: type II toxin-antitoxin system VapC family toxin [Nitrosospira sp.]
MMPKQRYESSGANSAAMVIDASVWVAALLTNDVHHGASAALLRALVLRKQQAATPVLAWPEIAGAIARRTGGGEWAKAAIAFLNRQAWLEYVSLDEALARRAIAIAIAQHLRGADAVYVALASQRDGMLITLDREMLERAPAPVTVRTPIDWLNNA